MDESFQQRLLAGARQVETFLAGQLADGRADEIRPPRLLAAMRHAVLGGGKRLRPFLVVETARMLGVTGDGPLRAGAALECVHCYSLVHDDLPAMDNDDMRRGRPTVHRAYDEATAILAGDALLTLAFEILADPATHADGAIRARLVANLARASGLAGMVGGQMLDLAAEGRFEADGADPAARRAIPQSVEAIRQLQGMKTGALFRFACRAGGLIGGATDAQLDAIDRYAERLGLAFQISDDLLDVEGDAATVGKATGKDEAAGKGTLVSLLGIDPARAMLATIEAEAIAALADFSATDTLVSLMQLIRHRKA